MQVLSDTNPFMYDKQALFDIEVTNSSSRSVAIGFDDVKCYVNDKEVKIIGRDEKLANIQSQKKKGRGAQAGKKILAAFAAGLANVNTSTTSYSGYAGSSNYSGVVNSTYVNQRQ